MIFWIRPNVNIWRILLQKKKSVILQRFYYSAVDTVKKYGLRPPHVFQTMIWTTRFQMKLAWLIKWKRVCGKIHFCKAEGLNPPPPLGQPDRKISIFRCASISWFQVVSKWLRDVFTASASTGLSDLFSRSETTLYRIILVRKCQAMERFSGPTARR